MHSCTDNGAFDGNNNSQVMQYLGILNQSLPQELVI